MTSAPVSASPGHPAPQRRRVRPVLLLAPLAAGAFAWILQLSVSYGVSGAVCSALRKGAVPLIAAGRETILLTAINLGCLALAVAAALASWSHWRKTRAETPGDVHAALSIGEGRTRFVAAAGILSSSGFALAILFNTVESLMVAACWTGAR